MTPRREFSARTKRQAWLRANGMCEGSSCLAPLNVGNHHYDHIDPSWMSARNSLDNCQLLCLICHKAKTRTDLAKIAKTKRLIKKRTLKKATTFRGWRKFDGTPVFANRRAAQR